MATSSHTGSAHTDSVHTDSVHTDPARGLLSVRRVVTAGVVASLALSLVACTGTPKTTAASSTSKSTSHQATRWWTDAAGSDGSKIDMSNPTSAAADLKPDTTSYCSVLSSTLKAGKSPFTGYSNNDPAVAASTQAWLAEVSALGPADLKPSWDAYSKGILALLQAASKPSAAFPSYTKADQDAQTAAIAAINSQAKSACGLDLFSGTASSAAATPSS